MSRRSHPPKEPAFGPSMMIMAVALAIMSLATVLAITGALLKVVPFEMALAVAGATTAVASAYRSLHHA